MLIFGSEVVDLAGYVLIILGKDSQYNTSSTPLSQPK
jgi:hypothetical protein